MKKWRTEWEKFFIELGWKKIFFTFLPDISLQIFVSLLISYIHPHCFNAVFRNGKNFKSSTRHKSHLAITTQAGNAKKKPFLFLVPSNSRCLYNRNRNKYYQLKWSLPKNNFLWHNLLSEISLLLAMRQIKSCANGNVFFYSLTIFCCSMLLFLKSQGINLTSTNTDIFPR